MTDFNIGSTFTSYFPSEQSCFLPGPLTSSFSCCFSTKAFRIPWSHLQLLCGFNGNNTCSCVIKMLNTIPTRSVMYIQIKISWCNCSKHDNNLQTDEKFLSNSSTQKKRR